MSLDIEALLDQATPQEETVPICLRGDLRGRWEQLDLELQTASKEGASLGDISPATQIARQMGELQGQIEAATVPFRLRAVDPREWSKFRDARPVKAKDQPDDEWEPIWHAWVCQVVALVCVEPVMTAEQVDRLVGKLSNRQWADLSNTAWNLNEERERVPFSAAASVLIALAGAKSRRPETPGPPSPDSSAGSRSRSPRTPTTRKAAPRKR